MGIGRFCSGDDLCFRSWVGSDPLLRFCVFTRQRLPLRLSRLYPRFVNRVELLFLGTGTSAGVPMIGCHCEVCSSSIHTIRRMRPSVVISYGTTRVLIDTTPELRLQCITNKVDRIDAVVFTHAHADHIMGLDDCRRFNYLKGGPLDVFGDAKTLAVLERSFGYAFKEPEPDLRVFRPHLVRQEVTGPFEVNNVRWTPIPLMHGDMPILGYRVGRVAYCTDVSSIPEASFGLLRDLDVLVLDALQYKRHITHFSVEEAIEAARRIGARQTLFTHIAHSLPHGAPMANCLMDFGSHTTGRLFRAGCERICKAHYYRASNRKNLLENSARHGLAQSGGDRLAESDERLLCYRSVSTAKGGDGPTAFERTSGKRQCYQRSFGHFGRAVHGAITLTPRPSLTSSLIAPISPSSIQSCSGTRILREVAFKHLERRAAAAIENHPLRGHLRLSTRPARAGCRGLTRNARSSVKSS